MSASQIFCNFAVKMKRLPLLFLVVLAICCTRQTPAPTVNKIANTSSGDSILLSDHMEAVFADSIAPPGNPPGAFPRNKDDELAAYFNDSNYIQYAAAEQLGIEPISDLASVYNTRRPLVKIESCEDYTVDYLTHSMPYLVPEAARLMADIGKSFRQKVVKEGGKDGYKVVVTSVLRTPATVKKLKKVNKNAVDSSTHMFATTFDLAYNGFSMPENGSGFGTERLKMILAQVLREKRDEGRCYVKYEKKSPCFHITVTK